ncbi:MAG: sigma factor-like helix-turn-helix DNA-binding protein, partial [Burkholderiales bacterium]
DMAAQLGVKSSDVSEMETRLSGHDVALEPAIDDEEAYSPIAYLSDPESEPSLILERDQTDRLQKSGLKHALESLDPRSRRIIEARWLREKDSATLHELAAEFKVSAERVRQLEQKALTKMKAAMVVV